MWDYGILQLASGCGISQNVIFLIYKLVEFWWPCICSVLQLYINFTCYRNRVVFWYCSLTLLILQQVVLLFCVVYILNRKKRYTGHSINNMAPPKIFVGICRTHWELIFTFLFSTDWIIHVSFRIHMDVFLVIYLMIIIFGWDDSSVSIKTITATNLNKDPRPLMKSISFIEWC